MHSTKAVYINQSNVISLAQICRKRSGGAILELTISILPQNLQYLEWTSKLRRLTVSGQDFFDEMWKNITCSPAITYDTP